MTTLSDIEAVNFNITNSKSKSVKVLYTIVFSDAEARLSRSKLKKFSGFNFEAGEEEYDCKLNEIKSNTNTADLISVCHILNIDYEGTKEDIAERILSFLCKIEEVKEDDEDKEDKDDEEDEDEEAEEDVEDEEDEEVEEDVEDHKGRRNKKLKNIKVKEDRPNATRRRIQRTTETMQDKTIRGETASINFRDIEDSIRQFNGKDGYPITKWLEDFEEIAQLMNWSDLQKLVFAKKSLNGLAKLLVQAERGITSWLKLKKLLRKEFEVKLSTADVHKLLMNRKKTKEESIQEYVLSMRELGSRASIEADAVIDYIIDGIPDDHHDKIILYGAKNFEEFKAKVKLYEVMKAKIKTEKPEKKDFQMMKNKFNKLNVNKTHEQKNQNVEVRCFSCGDKGHKSKDCPSKGKGLKCFKCNSFGHIAPKCTTNIVPEQKRENMSLISHSGINTNGTVQKHEDKMYKKTTINNVVVTGLVDTGSDLNIITKSCFECLNITQVNPSCRTLQGLGLQKTKTLGHFETKMIIDEEEFSTTIHIVANDVIPVNFIIGKELLNNAEVIIRADGLKITRIPKKQDENFLMTIHCDSKDELDSISTDVKCLIDEYNPKATKFTNIQTKIILSDEMPIYQHPRRLSQPEQKEVDRQINEWLENGIIKPSSSEFASPIVLVKKKNGATRICVDYRKINKKIVKDRYPLPLIEDQIDRLRNAKVFTTLDCENGFFHVPVAEECTKYTSFVTPKGQYEFLKTPFGMCNSPASFQRFINCIFKDFIDQGIVLVYMDDLVIPSIDRKEGLIKLKTILDRASEYGLKIKWNKCQFLQSKIEYLGYEIKNNKISPSKAKSKAVLNYPRPTTLKQIHSFLGLTGYFRKFVKNYAQLAKPLSDLLKKNATFIFGPEQEKSFELLKKHLVENPVLEIYCPKKKTELHTDACKYGYGAILLQDSNNDGHMHPIYYFSKKTSEAEQKYSSYELEVLGIIEALKRFRVYLLGIDFKIVTDCSAFEMTMRKKDLTTRVARWALLLEEFSYKIEHRAGDKMRHADALSRNAISLIIKTEVSDRIKSLQQEDEKIKVIMELLKTTSYDTYVIEHGLLHKHHDGKSLLVIPRKMQKEIIKGAHENGHFGIKKTEELILREYWIPKLREKITNLIKICIPCILAERKRGKQEGYLHPIDKGDLPLDTYHIDHLGPLSSTAKGYKYILAVVDAFTKFTWLYATKSTTTQEVIDKLEIQSVIFGYPRRIISDRGTAFTSHLFEEYCEKRSIKHILITTGVPRSNGQVERINQIIIPTLTKLTIDKAEDWHKHVNKLQTCLNNSHQRSIDRTPFEIMIGVKMRTTQEIRIKEIIDEECVKLFEEGRAESREEAKRSIIKIQEEYKKEFNKKRKPAARYKIGEWVAIKRTQFAPNAKIKAKFLGPYEIVKFTGRDRYAVRKAGNTEGPINTNTCADQMKPWCPYEDSSDSTSETDEGQDSRSVGKDY